MECLQGNYEDIKRNKFDLIHSNDVVKNTLNQSMSESFLQSWSSDISDIAIDIENERKILECSHHREKDDISEQCKYDLQDMKFSYLNSKFWSSIILEELYNDLKEELDIDISKSLWAIDWYIRDNLTFPESSKMSLDNYELFIWNIRTVVILQYEKIANYINALKKTNNGSLENLQWMINTYVQDSLETIRSSVLSSAKYYIEIQDPEVKASVSNKIWKLHVNMRIRQIEEAFITKKLLIDVDEWWFDFAQETKHTREIDEIPNDILLNDSFFTANNIRNWYRDAYLIENDLDQDGISISDGLEKLRNISILNEKDQQTEIEFILAAFALDAFTSLPGIWSIASIWISATDLFNRYDTTVEILKKLLPDELDQNYKQYNASGDYVLALTTLWASLIWLQGSIKWLKIAAQVKYLKTLNISSELIEQTFKKVWVKLWLSLEKINTLIGVEQKLHNVWDKLYKEEKRWNIIDHNRIFS